jgi:hypothetical protein
LFSAAEQAFRDFRDTKSVDRAQRRKRRPPKGGKRMRVENRMIVTGKIAAILAATAIRVAAVLAFASVA